MVAMLIAAGVTAALGFILAIVSLVLVIVAPSFDEFGQINVWKVKPRPPWPFSSQGGTVSFKPPVAWTTGTVP